MNCLKKCFLAIHEKKRDTYNAHFASVLRTKTIAKTTEANRERSSIDFE